MPAPFACSLPTDEADRRARLTRTALGDAVLGREEIEGGLRLHFPGDETTEAKLREVVDAESRCCAFLSMKLDSHGTDLALTVVGPPDARPMIDALFA